MTDAPHLSNDAPEGDWADRMEQTVLDAALGFAPRLGWNSRMVRAACDACGLSLGDEELLLPYDIFPWFKQATVDQITHLERPTPDHLYWPRLDVDLSVNSIRRPQDFPLVSKSC